MHRENCPVTDNLLINEISPKFEDLRKINGSKYNKNINKVLKSTLLSSGIFFRTVDNKYYFKEKEALDYIIKVAENILTKKMEKASESEKKKLGKKKK